MYKLLVLFAFALPVHAAQVTEIFDGDQLTLMEDGKTVKLRLALIDAPELDQPYGEAARQALVKLCLGKKATYRLGKRVIEGRMTAMVYCDEKEANRSQIKQGFAWIDPEQDVEPGYKLLQEWIFEGRYGLWRDPKPVPPWEWRKRNHVGGNRIKAFTEKPIE